MSVVINGCGSRLVRRDWERVVVHGLVVEKEGKEGCFVGSTGDLAGNHPGCRRERGWSPISSSFFPERVILFFLSSLFFFFALFFLLVMFCFLVFLYMFFQSLWFSL